MDLEALKSDLDNKGRLSLRLRVIPKSSRSEWVGRMEDGTLKLRLHATPERGKANEELIRFLASELGVLHSQIRILAGETSQNKLVQVMR